MNSKVGIFSILLFSVMALFISASSFSMVTAQEYHNYYNNKANFAEIERFDDKLFVCDNGIVVDDRTQCPLKCQFGTTLEGAYVMNLEICDIEPGTTAKKCPTGSDLEGVLVTNKNQCEIFAECDADSPLGLSLGELEPIKVADVQLCQLSAPDIQICDSGFFEGFAVDNQQTCNTVFDNVGVCGPTTNLAGMLTTNIQNCNIFTTCDANSNLGQTLGNTPVDVADPELCNLEIPEQTELFICDLDTPMGGAFVTDERLCQAPNSDNKCPSGTDLEGVYVMNTDSDCNIFATCDAGTPLGISLNMQNEFKVSDEVLCDLKVPEEIPLFECIGGQLEGAIVTDELLCQAPNNQNKCPSGTDLAGVYVMDTTTDCKIYETCPQDSLQAGIQVSDLALCNVINGIICDIGTVNEGAIVTDEILCQSPNSDNKCPSGTDLAGVYVMDTQLQCNIFTTCDVSTPLGQALDLQEGDTVQVADDTLCTLSVPQLETCGESLLGEGAQVTDLNLCNVPTDAVKCNEGTVMDGIFVMEGMESICMLDFLMCGETTGFHDALVTDPRLCNIVCGEGTAYEGAIVTDEILCEVVLQTAPRLTQTITVNKTTDCDPDGVGQQVCDNIPDAKIMALGNNTNPSIFLESQTPLNVTLEEGFYSIMEKDFVTGFEKCLPPFEAGRNLPQFGSDIFMCSELSEDCMGNAMGNGVNLLCNITNVVFPRIHDIVTSNGISDEISIFLGDGTGSFATSTEFTIGGTDPTPASVAVGHFNADTNLDIVTANFNSNEISVFLGDGTGSFTTSTQFTVGGTNTLSVAVGHFNADTNLDIVTANFANTISVVLNNGDGTFTTSTEFTVGGTNPLPRSVAVGFFNADTNLDIVTANINSDEISVFLGNGDGTFTTSTQFPVGGTDPAPRSVAVGHFNADTNLDIVTANFFSEEISVFLGDGTGTFTTSTEFTVGGNSPLPQSVAVGKFN